jgi:hypothetical protein
MTTARKAEASRINARRSTGPRTRLGKARASPNARRHGLSIPVLADGELCKEVEVFARKMVGSCTNADLLACAHRVAEAQVDLERVRRARYQLLARGLDRHNEAASFAKLAPQLARLERYERRALSRRKSAIRTLDVARMIERGDSADGDAMLRNWQNEAK